MYCSVKSIITLNFGFFLAQNEKFKGQSDSVMVTSIMSKHARKIWWKGVSEVLPEKAVKETLSVRNGFLQVQANRYALNDNVFLVGLLWLVICIKCWLKCVFLTGFGKAVARMAIETENILCGILQKGIISVPVGTKSRLLETGMTFRSSTVIDIYEGASNNLPDNDARIAAEKIVEFILSLPEGSILLVLISGNLLINRDIRVRLLLYVSILGSFFYVSNTLRINSHVDGNFTE